MNPFLEGLFHRLVKSTFVWLKKQQQHFVQHFKMINLKKKAPVVFYKWLLINKFSYISTSFNSLKWVT